MSARPDSTVYDAQEIPDTLDQDQLEEYIKYQDQVMERNAEELITLIEEHEKELEQLMEMEYNRTNDLYAKEDALDPLDEKEMKRLNDMDDRITKRISGIDQKTDEYMRELGRRIAEWSARQKKIDLALSDRAKKTRNEHWEERQEQRIINREYVLKYTQDGGSAEVWDEADVVVSEEMETVAQEGIEIIEEDQLIPEAIEITEPSVGGASEKEMKAATPVKEQIPQKKYRPPVKKPQARTTQTEAMKKRKKAAAPKYHTTIPGTSGGGSVQGRGHQYGEVKRAQTQRAASQPQSVQKQPQSYPCPVCQKPLVYYKKYTRWWCRSCKKWR